MSSQLRVGIVGSGAIATHGHIPALQHAPRAEIVAICDTNLDRAKATAAKFNIPTAYRDYQELVTDSNIDAVIVCVPNVLHAPVTLAALQAGKHVLSEKPLATSVADGAAMVAAAEQAGKILAVNMSNRPRAEVLAMRQAVSSGRLGRVNYAAGRIIRRAGIPGFGSWFTRRELSGGGALMDIGVHMLDMTLWILGFPEIVGVRGTVQAIHGPQERGLGGWGMDHIKGGTFTVDDFAAIHLRTADGGLITIEAAWAMYARDEERVQIAGDQGGLDYSVDLYGESSPLRFFQDDSSGHIEVIPTIHHKQGDAAWGEGVGLFVAACLGDGAPMATGADGLRILQILDATYRSAAAGTEVTI